MELYWTPSQDTGIGVASWFPEDFTTEEIDSSNLYVFTGRRLDDVLGHVPELAMGSRTGQLLRRRCGACGTAADALASIADRDSFQRASKGTSSPP